MSLILLKVSSCYKGLIPCHWCRLGVRPWVSWDSVDAKRGYINKDEFERKDNWIFFSFFLATGITANTPALARAEPWHFPRDRSIRRDPKTRLHTLGVQPHIGFSCSPCFTQANLTNVCEFGGQEPTPGCCKKLIHGCRCSDCRPTNHQWHNFGQQGQVYPPTLTLLVYETLKSHKSICCSSKLMSKLQHSSKTNFFPALTMPTFHRTPIYGRNEQNKRNVIGLGTSWIKDDSTLLNVSG